MLTNGYNSWPQYPIMRRKVLRIIYYFVIVCIVWLGLVFFRSTFPELKVENKKFSSVTINNDTRQIATLLSRSIKETSVIHYNSTNILKKPILFNGPKNARQQEVVKAFQHAWRAYKKYAWGHDELKPLSKQPHNWMGVGLFIVDTLDTAYIMNLTHEYNEGRQWISNNLNFTKNFDAQLFEVVIRALGGLMSLYYLTNDDMFLHKAKLLGDRLYPCISTAHPAIPCHRINLVTGRCQFVKINIAEVATIQLEFTALSRATGDPKYEQAVYRITENVHSLPKLDGLLPKFIQANGQIDRSSSITLGGGGDSYYEYILKQWLHTGKKIDWLLTDYLKMVEGVQKHLLHRSKPSNFAFLGIKASQRSDVFTNKMEHLTCFFPGTLVLGHINGVDKEKNDIFLSHLELAKELTRTCYEMYRHTPTHLSVDEAHFNVHVGSTRDFIYESNTAFYSHRPETVESIFYLYYYTKNTTYQDYGWNIFQAIEKFTKLKEGYATYRNSHQTSLNYRDSMETFFLAETLKYLYLLFDENPEKLLSLNDFVFNTEAHPLPIYHK